MQVSETAARAQDWSLWLTRQPSVTGSDGERTLPERFLERIRQTPVLAGCEAFLLPCAGDRYGRTGLVLLARGQGSDTVLLTGHYDTVTEEDYGALRELALDPPRLTEALIADLSARRNRLSHAEASALADLTSGRFLPGRGLLDMKGGLAAGLAAIEQFLSDPARTGNLLFIAVPDEEVNSAGARGAAEAMEAMEAQLGITCRAAINLDCIGDEGDGEHGRSVAVGSVGKVLASAFVAGVPSHAAHAFQGVNAGALAGAIAARLEWAEELADSVPDQPGVPPMLLSVRDNKLHYDVTTPAFVFSTFNLLSQGRSASAMLSAFRALVREAVDGQVAALATRRGKVLGSGPEPVTPVEILDWSQFLADLAPEARAALSGYADELAQGTLSLPEQSRLVSERAFALSGRTGPMVIIGVASLPYPPVSLGEDVASIRLRQAVDQARAAIGEAYGEPIGITPFFPGISDMSFFGPVEDFDLPLLIGNAPVWQSAIGWNGKTANIPVVNIGPWGRDFHTRLERMETRYAFTVLPQMLLATAGTLFTLLDKES